MQSERGTYHQWLKHDLTCPVIAHLTFLVIYHVTSPVIHYLTSPVIAHVTSLVIPYLTPPVIPYLTPPVIAHLTSLVIPYLTPPVIPAKAGIHAGECSGRTGSIRNAFLYIASLVFAHVMDTMETLPSDDAHSIQTL